MDPRNQQTFGDANPPGLEKEFTSLPRIVNARAPTPRYASEYFMSHENRGLAIIFNHENFDNGLPQRTGTKKDCKSLKKTFEALKFTVLVYNDFTLKRIQAQIDHLANHTDHSTNDCLVICILSHGNVGYICAKDVNYELDTILKSFTAEKCPSLAGKPKLFFVQACRGINLDKGVEMRIETDASDQSMTFKIPTRADFLIAYSTIPEYYSFRSQTKGARFVQSLCEVLNKTWRDEDLLSILTIVKRMVAFDFQSINSDPVFDGKKQMPCTVSMLTRLVYFRDNNLKGTMCCF